MSVNEWLGESSSWASQHQIQAKWIYWLALIQVVTMTALLSGEHRHPQTILDRALSRCAIQSSCRQVGRISVSYHLIETCEMCKLGDCWSTAADDSHGWDTSLCLVVVVGRAITMMVGNWKTE